VGLSKESTVCTRTFQLPSQIQIPYRVIIRTTQAGPSSSERKGGNNRRLTTTSIKHLKHAELDITIYIDIPCSLKLLKKQKTLHKRGGNKLLSHRLIEKKGGHRHDSPSSMIL
jgi:hypothetical protein